MKNILKNYFVLKIAQFDKISEVDTLSLKKNVSSIYDLTFSLNLWDKNLIHQQKYMKKKLIDKSLKNSGIF